MPQKIKLNVNEIKNISGGFDEIFGDIGDGIIGICYARVFTNLCCYLRYYVTQLCPDGTGKTHPLAQGSFNNFSEAYAFASSLSPCNGQIVIPIKYVARRFRAYENFYDVL